MAPGRVQRHDDLLPISKRSDSCDRGDMDSEAMTAANTKVSRNAVGSKVIPDAATLGNDGGRYRIRTYDFHRVKMALYR